MRLLFCIQSNGNTSIYQKDSINIKKEKTAISSLSPLAPIKKIAFFYRLESIQPAITSGTVAKLNANH